MEFHIGETGSQGAGEAGTLGKDVTRRWGCLLHSSGPSLLDSGAEDAESPVGNCPELPPSGRGLVHCGLAAFVRGL